ncbi:MAG: TolC family protein [Caldimonas sp.]
MGATSFSRPTIRLGRRWTMVAALALSGCASTAIDRNFEATRQFGREQFAADIRWLDTDEARRQAQVEVDARLAKPLSADDAVQLALAYSPAFQAMLFEGAADTASAVQSARLPNPVFAFERLVRNEAGARELEITRTLSISLLDLLLLPSRLRLSDYRQEAARMTVARHVVGLAGEARVAWINAVAAQQSLRYYEQVKATADAGAELARRMQAVGNFSKLQRAREQAFSAEAVAQFARASQLARSTREALVRALGLNDTQATQLLLPDRLPNLPQAPRDEAAAAQAAIGLRLDIQLSRASLEFLAREQGLTRVTSFVNGFDLGGTSKSETNLARQKGYELSLPLPIFDSGDASRSRAQATYLAALNRTAQVAVEASSRVREQYGAYRTAYDVAKHYRDEIVPLRKTIAEENVLRYNGMLIGVFELLADSRAQVESVAHAIEAQRDFWLTDAGLQASLIGFPIAPMAGSPGASRVRSGADTND